MDRLRRCQTAISLAVLALLAYVPSLMASPGRMPADSKLYVYLNPARFLADATTTFDPRQFAGWVPHQHIAYLWPTGPWFWLFETAGFPDWVAHRLWIGTLLVAAGLGVRYLARVLGASPVAALVAALVYQLSPYILPYVSRTSVLLLPWAGLGWIVAFTVLATRRPGWRYPAAIALVVLTVGAVNATALAMVIPAPALWLLHAAWGRMITWRKALITAAQTGLLCIGVSLWWIVMLVIQGRNGADVLAYSESLEAVSFTSTSTEVTRGLGYWLFYIRDAYSATTTASIDHLVSGRTILAGWLVMLVGFIGIAACRWPHRRFAALLVGAGIILGVGVHPIDDPSPLMSLLVGDGEGGLALALRSSTRAVPVLLLGVALGAAQVVMQVRIPRFRIDPAVTRVAAAAAVGVVAVVALPALRNGGFVDVALERDQNPPQAWLDAAADLDARPVGYRLLQVPGTEFGSFQWGYTVDQPLPALTERPLITRDLLPLGSPPAMDLAFALDDRFQTDTIEPEAVEAVARLMGVDTIWISGDVSADRFRLVRPEVVVDELSGLDGIAFGDPVVMGSPTQRIDDQSLGDPRIGRPIAPVTLADVADPIPTERVKDDVVLLAGSGDGIIDAAAAGVLDGSEAVLYTAALADDTPLPGKYRFVVTDSNRDRAHQWRSSQDVTGFTESADEASDVLRFESGDQRLPIVDDGADDGVVAPDTQTVSIQDGPVRAEASSYGERFAYVPEHRPVMAIDGDPDTSWLVADRFPAVGEFITLELDEPIDHIDLLQPAADTDERTITEVDVQVDGSPAESIVLDERSREGTGQRVDVSATDSVTITITATSDPQPPIGDAVGGVGFVEIGTGLEPTTEIIRTPVDHADRLAAADGVDIVLTRLRLDPTDRWRSDPEPVLAREFALPNAATVDADVTMRLDRRLDDESLADLLEESARASAHLAGSPTHRGAAAFDGDDTTTWITPVNDVVGQTLTYAGTGTTTEISVTQPDVVDRSTIAAIRVTDGQGSLDLELSPGTSTLTLPRSVDLAEVTIEISSIEERFTQDRRFNEPTVLPAAITDIEFDGESPAVVPVDRLAADCRDDLLTIDGEPFAVSFDIATGDALAGEQIVATTCSDALELGAGTHRLVSAPSADTSFDVDRVTFSTTASTSTSTTTSTAGRLDPTRPITSDGPGRSTALTVPACPTGCWVIHGQGYNPAWTASSDGVDLGAPTLIDGNANGWWLEPTETPTEVRVEWPVQRQLNIAFLLTAIAVLACVALVIRGGSRRVATPIPGTDATRVDAFARFTWIVPVASTVAAAVLIDWVWALPVAAIWAISLTLRRTWAVSWIGVATIAASALIVVSTVRSESPFPDAGWPVRFEWLHTWTLFGVVLLVTGALASSTGRERPQR